MLDPQAECPECGTKLGANRGCRECGWAPGRRATVSGPPSYVPPWKRPGFTPSSPEDPCEGGPDCTLEHLGAHTIRDHIEAFKKAGERIIARAVKL